MVRTALTPNFVQIHHSEPRVFAWPADAPEVNQKSANGRQIATFRNPVPSLKCAARLLARRLGGAVILELMQVVEFRLHPQPAGQGQPQQKRQNAQVALPKRLAAAEPFQRQMRQADGPAPVLQDEKAGQDHLRGPSHDDRPSRADFGLEFVGKNGGQTDDEENGRAQPQGRVENAEVLQESRHSAKYPSCASTTE